MKKTKLFQNSIGSNGWHYSLNPKTKEVQELKGKHNFDYVVVGAGFVGLAAARTLGKLAPNSSTLLLDATEMGLGTSARCSGFIIDTPHKGDLLHNNSDLHKQSILTNRKAIAWLQQIIEKENIQCDWQVTGKYQVAVVPRTEKMLNSYRKMLDNINESYQVFSRAELHNILGTGHYRSAIFTPQCVLMQPAAFVRGLANHLPTNVQLFDNTAVVGIQQKSSGIQVQTGAATIHCKQVVLATNIFSKEFGYLKNRLVPIITYASMTAPLNLDQQSNYSGQYGWGLTSGDKGGTTLRLTKDKRFVIRNHYTFTSNYKVHNDFLKQLQLQHYHDLNNRYPNLKKLDIEHTWGGVCAVARNFGFFAGEIDKNIFTAAGHSGVGAARGSLAGKAIAEKMILGKSEDLELLSQAQRPALNPPQPFLGVGVTIRLAYERWKSRAER